MNRATSGVSLPKSVANEIWQETVEGSAVMSLAQRIDLPGNGVTIPMVTGDATAAFVNESEEKPVSDATVSNKSMTGYKIAVIETFSNEFRRDLPGLYDALAKRLPEALAKRFDQAVFHDTVAPGSNFDLLEGAPTVTLDTTDTYGDLVAIDASISAANGVLDGWALSPKARGVLLSAKDADGRPLLITDIQREGAIGSLLGAPVRLSRNAYKADAAGDDGEVLGFAGDWTAARYGTVEGVVVKISDQATVNKGGTQVNLWQRNMFAVLAEIEVGFAVKDINKFVKILSGVNSVA
jgi:HK97 family phage major capsid protein